MKNSKKYISWFTVLILGLVFTMQFIPAKGIAASEENTAISFRFEGVVSSYEEMKAQDNSFEVYVKAQGDTEYKTLAQAASDNNGVYSLDAEVSSVSIYITLNKDKYMLMTDFNMFDTGISNAQTLTQKRTYRQETMRLYEAILSDADDNGLMVIFHGCTLPRGWERMYLRQRRKNPP